MRKQYQKNFRRATQCPNSGNHVDLSRMHSQLVKRLFEVLGEKYKTWEFKPAIYTDVWRCVGSFLGRKARDAR